MRVLIVEDDMILAMHLEMLVTAFGHEVCVTARSTDEALAQATALSPDIVLTDIRLARGSSGIDLARELHARTGLRCIFVSANLDEPTRKAVQPYDPIEFLGKPIVPVGLQRRFDQGGLRERSESECRAWHFAPSQGAVTSGLPRRPDRRLRLGLRHTAQAWLFP